MSGNTKTVHYLYIRVDVTGTNQKASTSLERSHIAELEMCNMYQLSKAHIIYTDWNGKNTTNTHLCQVLCAYIAVLTLLFLWVSCVYEWMALSFLFLSLGLFFLLGCLVHTQYNLFLSYYILFSYVRLLSLRSLFF